MVQDHKTEFQRRERYQSSAYLIYQSLAHKLYIMPQR